MDKIGAFSILMGQRANFIQWMGIYPLDNNNWIQLETSGFDYEYAGLQPGFFMGGVYFKSKDQIINIGMIDQDTRLLAGPGAFTPGKI